MTPIWFLSSVYWDYALVVPFSQIVCIHCHQQSEPPLSWAQGWGKRDCLLTVTHCAWPVECLSSLGHPHTLALLSSYPVWRYGQLCCSGGWGVLEAQLRSPMFTPPPPENGGTLVLVSQDGIQKPPLHFPQGGHLLSFLSCLENGLLPRGQLEPPLWTQQGKVRRAWEALGEGMCEVSSLPTSLPIPTQSS